VNGLGGDGLSDGRVDGIGGCWLLSGGLSGNWRDGIVANPRGQDGGRLLNALPCRTGGAQESGDFHGCHDPLHSRAHVLGHDATNLMLAQEAHDPGMVRTLATRIVKIIPPDLAHLPSGDLASAVNCS
jgi:hypothetical protein